MAEKLRGAHQVDIDPDFEPQSRPRSCTWPLPQPDFAGGGDEEDGAAGPGGGGGGGGGGGSESTENGGAGAGAGERKAVVVAGAPAPGTAALPVLGGDAGQLRKAKTSRRNAWGNLSYADLITKAIESAPDKRLTLSQIYDWMVRYVPYFKDKGDSNSSAGWKNSIRHNLSLHTRFIRVQNEGTGKSSWWMLNPEGGKTGKTPRRRAVSMDNASKFLRIKGKASKKKQIQAVGPERGPHSPAGAPPPAAKWSSSPASHGPGPGPGPTGSDDFEAWADFRGRPPPPPPPGLGSRISPLLAGGGQPDELEDEEAAPSSPLMYPSPSSALSPALGARCSVELPRLTDLAGPLSLHEPGLADGLLDDLRDGYGLSPPPPPPPGLRARVPPAHGYAFSAKCGGAAVGSSGLGGSYCGTIYSQPALGPLRRLPMQTIQENKQAAFAPFRPGPLQGLLASPAGPPPLPPARPHRSGSLLGGGPGELGLSAAVYPAHGHPPPSHSALAHPISLMTLPGDACGLGGLAHPGHPAPYGSGGGPVGPTGLLEAALQGPYTAGPGGHVPLAGQDRFPADLDLDMFSGSLECDVESIILNDFMDSDEMDFNFDSALPPPPSGLAVAALPSGPPPPNQSWVPG